MKLFSKHTAHIILNIFLILYMTSSLAAKVSHPTQPFPSPLQSFINEMVQKYHFDASYLNNIMSQADILPPVISHVEKPAEAQPWDFYRKLFITKERIAGGVRYWQQHQQVLAAAERKYGVDPSIIVAIIGVESEYGQHKAQYQELGALTTLAFYHHARSAFFESELQEYLILTRAFQLPPTSLRGSYAGALGIPQFMPSSYLAYAVSYQNQSHIDLLNNHDDAIMSIANYLHARGGWQAQAPIAMSAQVSKTPPPAALISKTGKPNYALATIRQYGVNANPSLPGEQKAALIAMHDSDHEEYWLTFQNFHAIMSYNPRTTYAMAVYQLSQIIRDAYEGNRSIAAAGS